MLAAAPIAAFVPVSDLAEARQFYADTLGLPVLEVTPFALVLTVPGGASVRCVLAPPFTPQPFTILGWVVPEIQAGVAMLRSKGIAVVRYPHFEQDDDGVWTAPGGTRILWFKDPFGNLLSLAEHGRPLD